MQHFGLFAFWEEGDWISHAIVLVLTLMSILSWGVILFKAGHLQRLKGQSAQARSFWQAGNLDDAERQLDRSVAMNPYLVLAQTAREAHSTHNLTQLEGALGPDEWLRRNLHAVLDDQLATLQSGLTLLASVGSTAPFVGLFGTVWGIYHALMSIGAQGSSSLDKVAGPVGEALVMTAFGLLVAIPAVLGYNAIARGNKLITHKLYRFTHDLEMYFVSGARHKPQNPVPHRQAGRTAPIVKPLIVQ